jgi:signal peptidase I
MGEFVAEETPPREGGRSHKRQEKRGGIGAILREFVIVIGLSLIIATLVRIFLVQAFLIPSASMMDTLVEGDRVLVSKLTTRFGEVERGDIVVFEDPNGWLPGVPQESGGVGGAIRDALTFVGVLPEESHGHLIKRVVGIGGDHVVCCNDDGLIEVNDVAIDETPYLRPGNEPSLSEFNIDVPEGEFFVLGDFRSNSGDSRINGTVPDDAIVGRAFAIAWPFSRWDGLDNEGVFHDLTE